MLAHSTHSSPSIRRLNREGVLPPAISYPHRRLTGYEISRTEPAATVTRHPPLSLQVSTFGLTDEMAKQPRELRLIVRGQVTGRIIDLVVSWVS